ncbi:MAG: AMP-binding protein [Acidimicrobiia bacterium]|nr:AMP-binding protein [Acidimicrobiia bacterium]
MVPLAPDTDWLARAAAQTPDAVAVVTDDGDAATYGRLDGMAGRAADLLSQTGVSAGDVNPVAVGDVDLDLVARLWAHWRLGVAPILVDARSPIQLRWGSQAKDLAGSAPTGLSSLHTVVLTSGSSGEPRPVRLTHHNVAAAIAASALRLGNTGRDRWLLVLPLFHIGGLSILWRSAAAGGTVVVHRRFQADRVATAFRDGMVTMASLVPTMLYRLLEIDPGPYEGLRAVLLGGAAANRELVERGLAAGLPILQTYGMTETCSQVATVVPGEQIESLGTAGRPLPGVTITTGEAGVGEIVVSGSMVSPGYLGESDRDSGHATGDIGYVDENGRLVVLGRADEMVITGGENVYPSRVASALAEHDALNQVEVVGVPDPEWGQSLVAVAVGDPAAQSALEAWAQQQLLRHEVPKRWIFVEALPVQAGGKIDRVALDEIARGDRT